MRLRLIAAMGLAVFAACTTPTSLCGCSPTPPPTASVVGTVRTAGGAPVRDVVVRGTGRRGSCPGTGPALNSVSSLLPSDSAGRYRVMVIGSTDPDTLCVQLIARRPAAAGGDSLLAPILTLQLRPWGSDSTTVDFTFP